MRAKKQSFQVRKSFFVLGVILLSGYLGTAIGSMTEKVPNTQQNFSGNPAAVYCTDVMGYDYRIENNLDGSQDGICILPDETECEQWNFYAGTCGAEYSYCVQEGYDLETRDDGQDPFSSRYTTCIVKDGQLAGTALQPSTFFDLMPNSEIDLDISDASLPPEDLMTADAVPTSWDWRNYNGVNWLTSVRNQANCGGCWSFAALGVTEAYYNIISSNPNLDLNLSEQDLISCSSAGTCNGGWTPNAFAHIRDVGVSDEACIPYIASDSSCNKCGDWSSRLTSIDNYSAFVPNQTSIKNAVISYGPVYASMGWDYGGYFDGDIYRCTDDNGTPSSNHAIVIAGYNDAGGYWLVRNSWGTGFEDGGYFKVGYDECYIDKRYAGYVYNVDDNYEQNDTPSAAYNLSYEEQVWLNTIDDYGIQADDDWYKIEVTSGYTRILVDLRFTHGEGDIDLGLYNSSGTLLTTSNGTSDNEYIDYIVTSGGVYYLKVYYGDAGNQYDLWWDDVIPPPPPPDNDDFDNAISISPTSTINLDTRGATQNGDDPQIPNCNMNAGVATIWYKYTPTSNSAISLDTKTSSYDTFIAVWTGPSRTNLSPVVCNDDIDWANGIRQSEVAFRVQANVTYYIEVGEWDAAYSTSATSLKSADTDIEKQTVPEQFPPPEPQELED